MLIRRSLTSLAFVVVLATAASAQDIVHLRSGKVLSGTILFEGDAKTGFTLRRWDTGGEVFIKWSQVPDSEAYRIRTRSANPDSEAANEELIDAVRIVTPERELIGIVMSEKGGVTQIKTIDGLQSTPKSAEQHRENTKVKESEVFTPDERVDRLAKKSGELDFPKTIALANFSASIKLFARARDYYRQAEKIAPADKDRDEAKGLASSMELRIVEDNAEKALAAVRELASKYNFDKAIQDAQKFLADFTETSVAKANAGLVAEIEGRRAEYQRDRDKILARDIPDHWIRTRDSLLSKLAGGKSTIQQAREGLMKLDEEIVAEVAKKLTAAPEEVTKHWQQRTEKRIRTVSMKDGSWIHRGGQDGGLDYTPDVNDEVDEFNKRFGDQQGKKKPNLGQKLETQQEWWLSAQSKVRKDWLECLYADTSANAKKESVDEKPCARCRGLGKIAASRGGKAIEYTCHECHGCKVVLTIKYW
jgi:tetratricopeptide (TPR) repeat protein